MPGREIPRLSVVILTRNEEEHLEAAVRSLLDDEVGVEVLVVDSASRDKTVRIARRLEDELGSGRVRLLASPENISIGRARNVGIAAARADRIAFMSADATASDGWAQEAVRALDEADIVYGAQVHAPQAWTVAAVVRGLRYHHFRDDATAPAETYASNVNAALRRSVFEHLGYVEDPAASALDDVLLTREAMRLGCRIAYAPRMIVRHKDVATMRQELRKNTREGYGWGVLLSRVGANRAALAWAALLAVLTFALLSLPAWPLAALLLAAIYAPTLRRVARAGRSIAPHAGARLVGATLLGPVFDMAFLASYLRGLIAQRPSLPGLRPAPTRAGKG